jgi:signal transduction histidine kinase
VEQHVLIVETPDQDVVITGDEQRLEQVLHNLLSNAIKYSPMGGTIRIAVTQTHDYGLMAVSDQGIGIPLSAQPNLFKQFFRASNVDPRQFSGLGIGLYLVHEIVTMHGGSIAVDSQEGEGSTFTVALPLRHQVIDHEVGGVST